MLKFGFVMFYQVERDLEQVLYIREQDITAIQFYSSEPDTYLITVGESNVFRVRADEVQQFLNLKTEEPERLIITRVERGETQNSSSPLWRCFDEDDNRINFFHHEDDDKNTYPLLVEAGYGDYFDQMEVGDTMYWNNQPILVEYRWNGQWREPTNVYPRVNDMPDDNENSYEYEDVNGHVQKLDQLRDGLEIDEDEDDDKPIIW